MNTEVIKINKHKPEVSKLKKAKRVLEQGGVIAFPTDTVYGLAAHAYIPYAQQRIYELKGRSFDKPLIIMPDDLTTLKNLAKISPEAGKLIKKYWPGALTLILPATQLGCMVMKGSGAIGMRIPNDAAVMGLLKQCAFPIATTSANPSSKPSAKNGRQAYQYFKDEVDLVLDSGETPKSSESTVLDVTKKPYKILRQGVCRV